MIDIVCYVQSEVVSHTHLPVDSTFGVMCRYQDKSKMERSILYFNVMIHYFCTVSLCVTLMSINVKLMRTNAKLKHIHT